MRDIHILLSNSEPEFIMSQARYEGFRFSCASAYPSDASSADLEFEGGTIEWKKTDADANNTHVIIRFDCGLLSLQFLTGNVIVIACAADDGKTKELLDLAREQVPPSELDEDAVEVSIWRLTRRPVGSGASSNKRKIACPQWSEISGNYAPATREALERLMTANYNHATGGKLVLWHGEPGTGKTYALRSWGRACRGDIDVHYICDPEVFFGGSADYMLDVLTRAPSNNLNLFVAEDTGELLARDARRQTGQALSRLLNTCDGLIGQGLRIMILITTNEDLGSLHPAIVRPGRCFANIGFETFSESEAREWLAARGVEGATVPARSTIAELYSMVENNQIVAEKEKVFGFVA